MTPGITERKGVRGTRYKVQVRRAGHPPITKTFGTLKAAEAFKRRTEGDIENGIASPRLAAKTTTLNELSTTTYRRQKASRIGVRPRARRILAARVRPLLTRKRDFRTDHRRARRLCSRSQACFVQSPAVVSATDSQDRGAPQTHLCESCVEGLRSESGRADRTPAHHHRPRMEAAANSGCAVTVRRTVAPARRTQGICDATLRGDGTRCESR